MEHHRLGTGLRVRGRAGLDLRLSTVTPDLRETARSLAPLPDQVPNAGNGRANLRKADGDETITACLALDGAESVAFFMLQTRMPELRSYLPSADVIGMRGFFVDRGHQRRGHGSAVLKLLPAFVRSLYPDATRIGLTVNVLNDPAKKTYLRAGFRDTGELYLGGVLGPQHVYVEDL